ncbi:lipopolysaccharide biosynthesis protein [Cellulomonas sp.]|uniref:lipopolysaccharide biosynthesis protein n=1 Tax=Cellulomonas sp. TaxID=40001 RepID=UPI003BAD05B3
MIALLSGPSTIVASRVASAALGLLSAPILARSLGTEGRGETAAALALTGLLPIALSMGIPIVARRRAAHDDRVAETVRTIRLLGLVAGLVGALVGWGSAALVLDSLDTQAQVALIVASAGCSAAGLLWISDVNILMGQERHGSFAVVNLVAASVFVALVAVAALTNSISVAVVIWLNLAAMVGTLVVSSLLVRAPLRGPRASASVLLRESRRYYGAQVAEAASYRLDQFFALPIIGAQAAGLYSVAATIALLPMAVGQAIGSSTFRSFIRAHSNGTLDDVLRRDVRGAMVAGWASALAVGAATPVIVLVFFGQQFAGAIIPAFIAAAGAVAVVAGYVVNSGLVALNKGWQQTTSQVAGLVVGVGLLVLLGPRLGAIGAAIASSCGYWVTFLVGCGAARVRGRELLPHRGDVLAGVHLLWPQRRV